MLKKIKIFLNKKQQLYFFILILGMLVSAVLEMIGIGSIPLIISLLVDPNQVNVFLPDNNFFAPLLEKNIFDQIFIVSLITILFFIIKNIFLFLLLFFQGWLFKDIKVFNSKKLYNIYINLPLTFHFNFNPALFNRNIISEVAISSNCLEALSTIIRESLIFVVILILLIFYDPIISLSLLLLIGSVSLIYYLVIRKKVKKYSEISQKLRGSQIKNINEVFGSIKETKIFKTGDYFSKEFEGQTREVENFFFLINIFTKIPRIFIEVIAIICIMLVALIFVYQGFDFKKLVPLMGLLVVASIRMIPSFNAVTASFTRLRGLMVSLDYITSEYKNLEKKTEKLYPINKKINNFSFNKITLKEIDYKYPETEKKVLKNVSLVISSGEVIGFVGKSGSGKTTLINLILGFLKNTKGQFLVDDKDIFSNLENWYSILSYIPQDIYLLDNTIMKNVAFGIEDKNIDIARVEKALKSAQIYDFISELPEGLKTLVGDRGVRLSGGQRQRIGIARALYRNPKILILDEATSSLDTNTESNFMDNIYELAGKCTVIIATHRVATLKNCDRIYNINNGKIEEIHGNKN